MNCHIRLLAIFLLKHEKKWDNLLFLTRLPSFPCLYVSLNFVIIHVIIHVIIVGRISRFCLLQLLHRRYVFLCLCAHACVYVRAHMDRMRHNVNLLEEYSRFKFRFFLLLALVMQTALPRLTNTLCLTIYQQLGWEMVNSYLSKREVKRKRDLNSGLQILFPTAQNARVRVYIYAHMHVHMYMCLCACAHVCLCVFVGPNIIL